MSAEVLILPVVRIPRGDDAALEQRMREVDARDAMRRAPPPRTRALLVHSERISARHYNSLLRRVSGALNDND